MKLKSQRRMFDEGLKTGITGGINVDIKKPNTVTKGVAVVRITKEIAHCDSVYAKMKYLRKSVDDVNDIIRPNQPSNSM